MVWRYLGDRRYGLFARAATTLQVMHPAISAGVAQHSTFFTEPIARAMRSIRMITGTVYDADAADTSRRLRDMHVPVKGTDHHGARYHALEPEVFYWAHATFVYILVQMVELLDHPMDDLERERLYQETCTWYRSYGISDRAMPRDWRAFCIYLEQVCSTQLEATPTALRGKAMFADPASIPQTLMPGWLWRLVAPPLIRHVTFMSIGALPPGVRVTMGYEWTAAHARRFERACARTRTIYRLLPAALRYPRSVRRAFARAAT
jgi:uncharacterized protein (DUF2236 family)